MKSIYFLLFTCMFMACNEPSDQVDDSLVQASNESSPAMLYFSGTIGQYPVLLSFTNGDNVVGQYRYLSNASFLSLRGTKSGDGQYTISEFNGKGVVTGEFKGRVESNGTFVGFWENKLKEKPKLYFELVSIDYNAYSEQTEKVVPKKESQKISATELEGDAFSGRYEYYIGGADAPTGGIFWSFTFDGADFSFEGSGSEECGTQITKGTGRLVSANVAEGAGRTEEHFDGEEEFSSGTCQYIFRFTENSVTVEQHTCGDLVFECFRVSLEGNIPRVES